MRDADQWHRNPDAHGVHGTRSGTRIDGLNRQLDVLAEVVWHRLVLQDEEPAKARSYVFTSTDQALTHLVEAVEELIRDRAVAADQAASQAGVGRQVGFTFAAGPLGDSEEAS